MERLRWSLAHNRTWTGLSQARASVEKNNRFVPRWLGIQEAGLILLAVIPGLGHILGLKRGVAGFCLFFGAIIAAGLAVTLYVTRAADFLIYLLIGMSIYSVSAVVDGVWTRSTDRYRLMLSRAGIALMVLATYLGGYMVARVAIDSRITVVNVVAGGGTGAVGVGDSVLISRSRSFRRGDFALGVVAATGTLVAGPVVGMPGDTIGIGDRVYVNATPTRFALMPAHISSNPAVVTLGRDQFWVWQNYPIRRGTTSQNILDSGLVSLNSIWGRAISVINPPPHRKWLNRIEDQ